jgi:predicted ATPase/DNA-binding SARP family transcriptional activator
MWETVPAGTGHGDDASGVAFRLLGPVCAAFGGVPVELGSRKQRFVLAVLLLEVNQLVPTERLIDLLWPDLGTTTAGPADPRGVLYTYLSKLRSALARANAGRYGVALERAGAGYVLRLDPDLVDAHRFRSLVRAARNCDGDGERVRLLGAALALWRGPALSSVADGEVRERIAHGLDEARLTAQEELLEARLRLGEHRTALAELTQLAGEHPDRQHLVGQLMLALYRNGRPGEALEVFRHCQDRLTEAGLVPAPELTRLQRAILRDDPALSADGTGPAPCGYAGDRASETPVRWWGPRGHLDRLIGRDRELSELPALLAALPLVTVTGAGGCGKTTLALRVAAEVWDGWSDGVVVLDLAAAANIGQGIAALATLLEITVPPGDEPLAAVERELAGRRLLLVLDNCEHLAASCSALCCRLITTCPDLTLLATSRQPLGIPQETVWPLATLAVPDADAPPDAEAPAVALFVARAAAALPTVPLTADDLPDVTRICRLLDGLPLAIELAAARIRTLPVRDLADRLDDSLDLLTRTTRVGDRRHRTLAATIDWSYRLLDERDQRLLARLAVFRGGFRLADAEAVCGEPPLVAAEVPLAVSRLVDRSLVEPYDSGRQRRFRLHHAVRLVAADQLAATGDQVVTADRHLDHWLRQAHEIDALPTYPQRVAAARAREPDLPNVRAALDHGYATGRSADAADLTARLLELWLAGTANVPEGERRLTQALRAGSGLPPAVVARLRYHRAMLLPAWGDSVTSLDLTRDLVDDLARYWPREHLGARANLLNRQRMLLDPAALASVPAVLDACATPELADRYGSEVRTVLTAAGWTMATWGRYADAAELCRRYTRILTGPPSLSQLGLRTEIAIRTGTLSVADNLAATLRDRLSRVPHPAELELPRRMIALTYLATGRPGQAADFLTATLAELPTGLPIAVTSLLVLRAEALRRGGQPRAARLALADALEPVTPGSVEPLLAVPAIPAAALVAADLGDVDTSTDLAAAWDALRHDRGLPAPTGLHQAVGSNLGLDPDPPAAATRQANQPSGDLYDLVDRARDWCLSTT